MSVSVGGREMKVYTQDEFVAALFDATTYHGKTILQVKVVPQRPGFVGKVFITVEDLMTSDGVRTTYTTFGANSDTHIDPMAFGA